MKKFITISFIPFLIGGLLRANSALTELEYDSSKTYSKGDAVIPSATEFTLYTAKTSVPAGQNGPPNTAYWQTAEEYSTELQSTHSGTVSTPPSSDNINTNEIDDLGTPGNIDGSSGTSSVAGDLNGDGIPDIVWQKSGTNETRFWYMNTDGTKKSEFDLVHSAGSVWKLSSLGDMNNDGNVDLLWQKEDGSTVFCYYMDGSGGITQGVSLASGVAAGWRFASAADYNGDGDVDFLWHSTSKGSTVCWHFDGNGVVNGFSPLGSGIGDVFNSYSGQDMNADGNSDVIYQNSNNGRVLVWYFDNNKNILGTNKYFETLDTSLKVVGAKDYDKDGAVDILLQHSTTGVAKIVYFDTSGTQLSEKEIGTVDTSVLWEIRN
jgi:hypothetical protein